jgi:two-component system chemotaxis sensor kinase CheA
MTKDVNEQVLDAFRIEHREQLEQIRELLSSLEPGDVVTGNAHIRDAFRLAHSLKGGARVCDLRGAEQLGHGLESVLEQVNCGNLPFTLDTLETVNLLLDCIEDWMAAYDESQPLPEISDALAAVEQSLVVVPTAAFSTNAKASKEDQLQAVFAQECAQHIERIKQLLADWEVPDCERQFEELGEVGRIAHTLAGAAAVVDLPSIEAAARQIEQFIQAVRSNDNNLDTAGKQQIREWLDAISQSATRGENATKPQTVSILEAHERSEPPHENEDRRLLTSPRDSAESSPSSTSSNDTVRVHVGSLDRLMRSTSELWAENLHVDRLARQLLELQGEIIQIERERETIRQAGVFSRRQSSATLESDRVSRYIDFVDDHLSALAKRTRQLSSDGRRVAWQLRARTAEVQRDVQQTRLVPAHNIFQGFRKMIRDIARSEGKEIDFQDTGMDLHADRMVLQELKNPIMHALRNCVSHGVESPQERRRSGKPERGSVSLSMDVAGGQLIIVVEDDGHGFHVQQIQKRALKRGFLTAEEAAHQSTEETLALVFEAGFSTSDSVTELAGRGMGLSIVRDAALRLQGNVFASIRPEGGARLTLTVPVFVSTHRVLLVECGDQRFAVPTHGIERLLRVKKDELEIMEGLPIVTYNRRPVRLVRLADILSCGEAQNEAGKTTAEPVVLLKSGDRFVAVSVDALLEERDVLISNLDEFAESRHFTGGVLLDDGKVALVVNPNVLMETVRRGQSNKVVASSPAVIPSASNKVLIVDDSFTTRTLEKNILESQGFETTVAVDGVEALSLLRQQKFDLVITDVEMPRMDGFGLLEKIKADARLASTPVILVTSRDRQEDQRHGLDLGADAYIVKRKFDHQELLSTIRQLI